MATLPIINPQTDTVRSGRFVTGVTKRHIISVDIQLRESITNSQLTGAEQYRAKIRRTCQLINQLGIGVVDVGG